MVPSGALSMERGPCSGAVSGALSGVSAMSPLPAKVVMMPVAAQFEAQAEVQLRAAVAKRQGSPFDAVFLVDQGGRVYRDAELLKGLDRFGHVEVAWGHPMTSITETADGVTVVCGERKINARYVVGCDGGRSATRPLPASCWSARRTASSPRASTAWAG